MKKLFSLLLIMFPLMASAQGVALNTEGQDSAYVQSIVGRSQKIVDKLEIKDEATALSVRNIIANRYFLLNDIYKVRDAKKKAAKDAYTGKAKDLMIEDAEKECSAELYKHHFEFESALSCYLPADKVEAVKDGMTYNVVKVTYDATLDMIPSLKEEEKVQILAWLKEAREFAMDAENSNKKHGWFGKYKGRINNYLSKRGYDLVKEREGWYKRIEERKAKEAKKKK